MGKKSKRRHSSLKHHAKKGSVLKSKLSSINIQMRDWERDGIPEHLWITALCHIGPRDLAHNLINELLDVLDPFNPDDKLPLLGLISDFGRIPVEKRNEILGKHGDVIEKTFLRPVGRILAFYPGNPASWLITPRFLEKGGSLDPQVELSLLRDIVLKLYPAKDEFCGHVRLLPSIRLYKHDKVFLNPELPVASLLPKYPKGLNESERYLVQTHARQLIGFALDEHPVFSSRDWPKQFWRQNYNIADCSLVYLPPKGSHPIPKESMDDLEKDLAHNAFVAESYLGALATRVPCDLYDPTRDEIFFGLISRAVRLYILLNTDPNTWARDVFGIFLRCLADTVITFAYLAKNGKPEDFLAFRKYGEGQEKLIMLHLQDNYPEGRDLVGRNVENISDELGDFNAEFIDIELGSWSGKDTRRLAQEAGLEKIYRLVFSPSSGDLHGSWLSLKHSNLLRCREPLHRFHRLPHHFEPLLFVGYINAATTIFSECIDIATQTLGFPGLNQTLRTISSPSSGDESENDMPNDNSA
jgi:hypothetical protein